MKHSFPAHGRPVQLRGNEGLKQFLCDCYRSLRGLGADLEEVR